MVDYFDFLDNDEQEKVVEETMRALEPFVGDQQFAAKYEAKKRQLSQIKLLERKGSFKVPSKNFYSNCINTIGDNNTTGTATILSPARPIDMKPASIDAPFTDTKAASIDAKKDHDAPKLMEKQQPKRPKLGFSPESKFRVSQSRALLLQTNNLEEAKSIGLKALAEASRLRTERNESREEARDYRRQLNEARDELERRNDSDTD